MRPRAFILIPLPENMMNVTEIVIIKAVFIFLGACDSTKLMNPESLLRSSADAFFISYLARARGAVVGVGDGLRPGAAGAAGACRARRSCTTRNPRNATATRSSARRARSATAARGTPTARSAAGRVAPGAAGARSASAAAGVAIVAARAARSNAKRETNQNKQL